MKAVLVIDLPKKIKADEVKGVRITFYNGLMNPISSIAQSSTINSIVRPLPQKKEIRNSIQYRGLAEEYRKEGWNECLDEITGGIE